MNELRYAFRGFIRRPAFAIVAIATLAIGIGAVAAIFSLIDAILLRPLPYPEANRIVMAWGFSRDVQQRLGFDRLPSSPADYTDYSTRNTTLQYVASIRTERVNLTGGGDPERVASVRVTGDFFRVLGIEPMIGRTFVPDDARRGDVVLLAERIWRTRFQADPAIAGRVISLNSQPATIIGVLPSWFRFPAAGELPEGFGFSADPVIWSLDVILPEQRTNRGAKSRAIIGRLQPGVTARAAEEELATIAADIARAFPGSNAGWTIRVVSLREQLSGRSRPALMVLLTAVGFVLLIACANVANLLLVRAAARQRELCIRRALGATRQRLMVNLMAESMLLAVVAGGLGVAIAWGMLRALLAALPTALPALADAGLDLRVLSFSLAVSVITGIAFGYMPAHYATACELNQALREGGRGTVGSRGAHRTRNALVVLEVAVSVLLLIGTMLLVQTFVRLTGVHTGFQSDGVLTMEISLPPSQYPGGQAASFFDRVLAQVSTLPGVEAAAVTSGLPLSSRETLLPVTVEGQPRRPPGREIISDYRVVSSGYFRALGIPLVDGALLPERPEKDHDLVVVINETMARVGWPGQSPIGRNLKLADFDRNLPWHRVVGVVGDTKYSALDSPLRAQAYVDQRQDPSGQMALVLRTFGDPLALVTPARAAVAAIDPNQPVARVRPMTDVVDASVSNRRFPMLLIGLFAAFAATLSLVGLYAVVSYSVAERLHEMGVRLALGAQPSNLLAMVLKEGVTLVAVGIVVGLAAAMGLTHFLETQLFGVHARDLSTFVLVPSALFVAALLGCLVPARRAMRVDPATALRE